MKRVLYVLFVIIVALTASLAGAAAGGIAVYRAMENRESLPAPLQDVIPANDTNPGQTITLDTTDIETSITQLHSLSNR